MPLVDLSRQLEETPADEINLEADVLKLISWSFLTFFSLVFFSSFFFLFFLVCFGFSRVFRFFLFGF